jgi:hypothetical protein
MSNVVNITAKRREQESSAPRPSAAADTPELRALVELQALCAKAIEAGGLDAGGPTALDFTVTVHRAVKGTEWSVRFRRNDLQSGQAPA